MGHRRRVGLIRQINTCAAKYLYWPICKKSRHLGFGVFIYIWSMGRRIGRQGAPRGGNRWWMIRDVVAGRSVVAVATQGGKWMLY
jgi:hypothetical protein